MSYHDRPFSFTLNSYKNNIDLSTCYNFLLDAKHASSDSLLVDLLNQNQKLRMVNVFASC